MQSPGFVNKVPTGRLYNDQTQPDSEPPAGQQKGKESLKILRFCQSERYVHWALAIPFLVCYASAAVLVFHYNPDPSRAHRDLFSWIHRISGVCLIVLPMLAVFYARGDIRIHFYNIGQAWKWAFDDVKWLLLKGVAVFSKRIKLPEQGKFNAAEKLNFMVLLATYPLYVTTGLAMWLTHAAVISWIIHVLMAMLATPLILGHIYMATINPQGRKRLSGMISGKVDRDWAKDHYTIWYREHFENGNSGEIPSEGESFTKRVDENDLDEFEMALQGISEQSGAEGSPVKMHYYIGLACEESGWTDRAIDKYSICLVEWRGEEECAREAEDAKKRIAKLLKSPQ